MHPEITFDKIVVRTCYYELCLVIRTDQGEGIYDRQKLNIEIITNILLHYAYFVHLLETVALLRCKFKRLKTCINPIYTNTTF